MSRRHGCWFCLAWCMLGLATHVTATAAELLLVREGAGALPIVLDAEAPPTTTRAAEELAGYIEKISGARPAILVGTPNPVPASAIWLGSHPRRAELMPKVDFNFNQPEAILIVCDGQNLVIAGRDRSAGESEIEHGTANAIYTFIEKVLGVRWLWPGELGEDIPQSRTIAIAPVAYRFAPQFRKRKLWPESPRDWFVHQRLNLHSYPFTGGHAFTDWWEKYGEDHPDYFAMQPDGKRGPHPAPRDVKLCLSNPAVWKQWLDNVEEELAADPSRIMFSASPNDGPGECVCENCRAWDHPDGPMINVYGRGGVTRSPSLTDRHIKFWNILARGLRERFPGRDLSVGAYAYGTYRTAPVAEVLEPNVVVGYVGHFPLASDEVTADEKQAWLGWAQKATAMVFRPNLFHYSGGWLGLPTVATARTSADFRWLAENKCIGVEVDTLPRCWSTQGVQFYLMAKLTYDPLQNGAAVLKDYYSRGFGPAADAIEAYFAIMESAHEAILKRIKHSGAFAREAILVYQDVYTDELLENAATQMRIAAERVAESPQVYRDRVAFIDAGFEFTRLQVRLMRVMKRARESKGADREAVEQGIALSKQREAMFEQSPPYALRPAAWYHDSRKLDDYMGPPSAALRKGPGGTTGDGEGIGDFIGRD